MKKFFNNSIKNIFEIWEIPVIVTSMMFKIEIVIGCYILKSFNRLYKPYMKYIIIHAFALFDFKNIFYLIKKRHWSWRLNKVENYLGCSMSFGYLITLNNVWPTSQMPKV